ATLALTAVALAQEPAVPATPVPAPPAAPLSSPSVAVATLPRDLSPWGMFLNADVVVQVVMASLVVASLFTWTIWLVKTLEIWFAKRRVRAAIRILQDARSLAEAEQRL